VRSESFYPSDPFDGEVIYEGRANKFEDVNVEVGVRYYYTLFAKSKNGEFSSGVIDSARIPTPGEPARPPDDIIGELPQAPNVHPDIEKLSFLDFDFIQDGKKVGTFSGDTVAIDGSKNLTVSLDAGKVPDVLKSILVTLTHPNDVDKKFSFLLRINESKTVYTATIGPLGDSGRYGAQIAIIDYKNQGLKKISGEIYASANYAYQSTQGFVGVIVVWIKERFLWLILGLVLGLVLWRLFSANKKKVLVSGVGVALGKDV
jgi:hypothetical protein